MAEVVYENHLKCAYSVKPEGKHFVVTETSFYKLSDETAWLIKELPVTGTETSYCRHMSVLGLKDPHAIFDRLVSIEALVEKRKYSLATIIKRSLNPKIQLISSRIQEKFLVYLGLKLQSRINRRVLAPAVVVSVSGLLWGGVLSLAGPGNVIPVSLTGHPSWIQVFLLVLIGSLAHELGHSLMAAISGIGLRPIGLSIYLVFPVFFTNISGIENVTLRQKTLINCGGFLFQGIFLFLLLISASLTGKYLFAEASRWMMVLVFFNLNPFLRTDGYWIYKDLHSGFRARSYAQAVHILFLVGYSIFSVYFLLRVGVSFVGIYNELTTLASSPRYILSKGYMVLVWAYFLIMGFVGSIRRFKEIQEEWY